MSTPELMAANVKINDLIEAWHQAQAERDRALVERDELAATLRQMEAERVSLRQALAYYTDATGVASWDYEELFDMGQTARTALGYGEHDPKCKWPNEAKACTCGLEKRIAADLAREARP